MSNENIPYLSGLIISGKALQIAQGQLYESNPTKAPNTPVFVGTLSRPSSEWAKRVDAIEAIFAKNYDLDEYAENLALQVMSVDEIQTMLTYFGVELAQQANYQARPLQDKKILNIGTGTGREVIPLSALGASVTGIDATIEYVEQTAQKITLLSSILGLTFSTQLFQCLAESYPYDQEVKKFDGVTSLFGVLNHVEDWATTLQGMISSLKLGGRLVLSLYGQNQALVFEQMQLGMSYSPSILQRRDVNGQGILLGDSDQVLPANFPAPTEIVSILTQAGMQVNAPRGLLRIAALFPKVASTENIALFLELLQRIEPEAQKFLSQFSATEDMLAAAYAYDQQTSTHDLSIQQSAYVLFTAQKL